MLRIVLRKRQTSRKAGSHNHHFILLLDDRTFGFFSSELWRNTIRRLYLIIILIIHIFIFESSLLHYQASAAGATVSPYSTATVDLSLSISIPAVDYQGTSYQIILNYYEEHQEAYQYPSKAKLSMIVINGGEEKEAAYEKAMAAYKELSDGFANNKGSRI